MGYDVQLVERIQKMLSRHLGVSERKMFGGFCFLVNGNLCCGVDGRDLMLRLGQVGTAAALEEPHTRPFDVTGRRMKTMLFVSPQGYVICQ